MCFSSLISYIFLTPFFPLVVVSEKIWRRGFCRSRFMCFAYISLNKKFNTINSWTFHLQLLSCRSFGRFLLRTLSFFFLFLIFFFLLSICDLFFYHRRMVILYLLRRLKWALWRYTSRLIYPPPSLRKVKMARMEQKSKKKKK